MAPRLMKTHAMMEEHSCYLNLQNIEDSCLLRGPPRKSNLPFTAAETSKLDTKSECVTSIIRLSHTETDKISIIGDEYKQKETKYGKVKEKNNYSVNQNPTDCNLCKRNIENKYLLYALDKYWHEKCLKCDFCRKPLYKLGDKFFFRQGAKFCREDFLRTFGDRGICCMCDHAIPPTDYVLKFKGQLVYHLDCFKCTICRTRFCVGDPVSISDPKNIICATCKHIPMDVLKQAYIEKYDKPQTTKVENNYNGNNT